MSVNAGSGLFRRKYVDRNETSTELHRVLSTLDLTLLGIGSTLGLGIYVLAGQVAKESAGPAVVLSFLVAAFTSVLAGLCYAEFGARVPKAGSAYVYSYVCVGEFIAFIVGWNLIMEYIIGVASVSKAYSETVDTIIPDHAMSQAFKDVGSINVSFLGSYFDFFAFGIAIALTILLVFGVKESSVFNNVCTGLNLLVVVFSIIAGSFYSSTENWKISSTNPPPCKPIPGHTDKPGDVKEGGFLPFGIAGMLSGAATCFYGFIGFDVLATTGEEAKNPKKSIPLAIVMSLFFIFLAYFGTSTVLTMMVPYYCQDDQAPLPLAFEYHGFTAGRWVVSIGSLFGLSTSLLGSMFPMPRIIYSMAHDGLLFKFLAHIHPKYQTPIYATLIGGTIGALMGALFDLSALIDMMSIGTLTAYTIVALCVMMLRYRPDEEDFERAALTGSPAATAPKNGFISRLFNGRNAREPSGESGAVATFLVVVYWLLCFGFCGVVVSSETANKEYDFAPWKIALISVFGALMLIALICLSRQAVSKTKLNFKVPLVPWIPAASVLVNTFLMMKLSWPTWVRFGIWLAIGLVIYLYCLCTGRASRVYKDKHALYLNSRNGKKISFHGIDNPALIYSEKDEMEEADSRVNKQRESEMPGGNYGSIATLPVAAAATPLSLNGKLPAADSDVGEGLNAIDKIHGNVQKSMNGEVIQLKDLVLSQESNPATRRTQNVNLSRSAAFVAKPPAPVAVLVPIPAAVRKTHEESQKSLNAAEERQAAIDFVDGIVSEAESAVRGKTGSVDGQTAEEFVEHVFRKALSQVDSEIEPEMSGIASFDKDSPLPPFMANTLPNETHQRLKDLVEPKKLQASEVSDVIGHIHAVGQASLNNEDTMALGVVLSGRGGPVTIPVLAVAAQSQRSPTASPPALPEPFISKVFITHEAAKESLKSQDSIEEIHQNCQTVIDGADNAKYPVLVSPAMREDTKEAIKKIISGLEPNISLPAPPPAEPPAAFLAAVVTTHEAAKKELAGPNPVDQIHQVSQKVLDDIEDAIQDHPLLLTSRAENENGKEAIKQLLQSAKPNSTEVQGRPEISPEDVALMMIAHAKAKNEMDELRSSLHQEPEDPTSKIHEIAQLSLNGVDSVPWMEPVLVSDEAKKQIAEITKSLRDSAQANAPAPITPDPLPPVMQRKLLDQVQKAHVSAQKVLDKSTTEPEADEATGAALEDEKALDPVEYIHKIAQMSLDGVNLESIAWLEPVLMSEDDKRAVQETTHRLRHEARKNAPKAMEVPKPQEPSPEAVEFLLALHQGAQDCLDTEITKTVPETVETIEDGSNVMDRIHATAQLAFNGVPLSTVAWLEPVLASDEDKKQIKEITERLRSKEAKSVTPPSITPPETSPELLTAVLDLHTAAQDKLNEFYVTAPQTPVREEDVPIIDQIHKMAQMSLDGAENIPQLAPINLGAKPNFEIEDLANRLTTAIMKDLTLATTNGHQSQAAPPPPLSPTFANKIEEIHEDAQRSIDAAKKKARFADASDGSEEEAESMSPKQSKKRHNTVSFSEDVVQHDNVDVHEEIEEDLPTEAAVMARLPRDAVRQRIMNRRPTGPTLPMINKFHASLNSPSMAEGSEDEDVEEEAQDAEVASSSSSQNSMEEDDDLKSVDMEAQPAVPRRQSNTQQQSTRDLIALFEKGKEV